MLPILSILICTVDTRSADFLPRLLEQLKPQLTPKVEVLYLGDIPGHGSPLSLGKKRNKMLSIASGRFVVFIDDDDRVSPDFVSELLKAIALKPDVDVINYIVECSIDGESALPVYYSISFAEQENLPDRYLRWPNALMCISLPVAIRVGFNDMGFGEDTDFGARLSNCAIKEHQIDKVLYYYDYNTSTSLFKG
jgi:glycosyltransferase involved in cell wall biosynthesis